MYSFVIALIALVLGFFLYGKFVEKIIAPDSQKVTPCYANQDGVDFIPMPTWKVLLIQFLNIAGIGPIFGVIQGILFGPAAYFWIVLGCVFGGAVHDYVAAMASLRRNGASLPEIIGDELGNVARIAMRLFALVLMILVGAVFVTTPAGLLESITGAGGGFVGSSLFWMIIILLYYILATVLPIDKLIGRVYPLLGFALLAMAAGMLWGVFFEKGSIPEVTTAFANHHPSSSIPLFPGLCITIACGAVSGFHATQSPMMVRCLKNESLGRVVFYGAMIIEGIVALIWAAAAIKFADSITQYSGTPYQKLWALMTNGGTAAPNPAVVVDMICHSWLGMTGAVLAILGVVAAPITTGDTAFRCARLIAADFLHIKQDKVLKRLFLSLPIFAVSIFLLFVRFDVLWRYLAWFNQILSVFTLWAVTVWLAKQGKNYFITLFPALFMTCVCTTYICVAPEGFTLSTALSYAIGLASVVAGVLWFYKWKGGQQ